MIEIENHKSCLSNKRIAYSIRKNFAFKEILVAKFVKFFLIQKTLIPQPFCLCIKARLEMQEK